MPFTRNVRGGVATGVRSLGLPLAAVESGEQVALPTAAATGWSMYELPDMLTLAALASTATWLKPPTPTYT